MTKSMVLFLLIRLIRAIRGSFFFEGCERLPTTLPPVAAKAAKARLGSAVTAFAAGMWAALFLPADAGGYVLSRLRRLKG